MRLLLIALLILAQKADKPRLETRVFPPMQNVNLSYGCSEVLFTAELKGPESEDWYCPKVSWEQPDGTLIGSEESDCPPYELRHQCAEDQTGCGLQGFRLDPITNKYVDIVKDCPCTIHGYQRIWRRRACVPAHPYGDFWTLVVRLEKNGKTIAKSDIQFAVK